MFIRQMRQCMLAFTVLAIALPSSGMAGDAKVVDVKVSANGDGTYMFSATLLHKDTGWDHYADKWDVLGPDGKVLATRVLYHPHVNEQPFTRSLSRVAIPVGIREVSIRAHDKVHGDGKETFKVTLPPLK